MFAGKFMFAVEFQLAVNGKIINSTASAFKLSRFRTSQARPTNVDF